MPRVCQPTHPSRAPPLAPACLSPPPPYPCAFEQNTHWSTSANSRNGLCLEAAAGYDHGGQCTFSLYPMAILGALQCGREALWRQKQNVETSQKTTLAGGHYWLAVVEEWYSGHARDDDCSSNRAGVQSSVCTKQRVTRTRRQTRAPGKLQRSGSSSGRPLESLERRQTAADRPCRCAPPGAERALTRWRTAAATIDVKGPGGRAGGQSAASQPPPKSPQPQSGPRAQSQSPCKPPFLTAMAVVVHRLPNSPPKTTTMNSCRCAACRRSQHRTRLCVRPPAPPPSPALPVSSTSKESPMPSGWRPSLSLRSCPPPQAGLRPWGRWIDGLLDLWTCFASPRRRHLEADSMPLSHPSIWRATVRGVSERRTAVNYGHRVQKQNTASKNTRLFTQFRLTGCLVFDVNAAHDLRCCSDETKRNCIACRLLQLLIALFATSKSYCLILILTPLVLLLNLCSQDQCGKRTGLACSAYSSVSW